MLIIAAIVIFWEKKAARALFSLKREKVRWTFPCPYSSVWFSPHLLIEAGKYT